MHDTILLTAANCRIVFHYSSYFPLIVRLVTNCGAFDEQEHEYGSSYVLANAVPKKIHTLAKCESYVSYDKITYDLVLYKRNLSPTLKYLSKLMNDDIDMKAMQQSLPGRIYNESFKDLVMRKLANIQKPIIPTKSELKDLNTVNGFRSRFYNTGNIVFSVSGDVTVDDMKNIFEEELRCPVGDRCSREPCVTDFTGDLHVKSPDGLNRVMLITKDMTIAKEKKHNFANIVFFKALEAILKDMAGDKIYDVNVAPCHLWDTRMYGIEAILAPHVDAHWLRNVVTKICEKGMPYKYLAYAKNYVRCDVVDGRRCENIHFYFNSYVILPRQRAVGMRLINDSAMHAFCKWVLSNGFMTVTGSP